MPARPRPARPRARPTPLAMAALGLAGTVSGCALPIQAEMDRASDVALYALHYDHLEGPEANLLDRALARCGEKVPAAETACVRSAVTTAGLTPQGLAALVPGCRPGTVCHYDHVTRDRLGFVNATATEFVKRWRVDLDLRKAASDVAHVPIAVFDRDDFDAPRPPPG